MIARRQHGRLSTRLRINNTRGAQYKHTNQTASEFGTRLNAYFRVFHKLQVCGSLHPRGPGTSRVCGVAHDGNPRPG
jgi:hypothetical protein